MPVQSEMSKTTGPTARVDQIGQLTLNCWVWARREPPDGSVQDLCSVIDRLLRTEPDRREALYSVAIINTEDSVLHEPADARRRGGSSSGSFRFANHNLYLGNHPSRTFLKKMIFFTSCLRRTVMRLCTVDLPEPSDTENEAKKLSGDTGSKVVCAMLAKRRRRQVL